MRNLAQSNGRVKGSKADQIRALLYLPNLVIAERTGYAAPYIRAVRQRTNRHGRPQYTRGDRAWAYSERHLATMRDCWRRNKVRRQREARP